MQIFPTRMYNITAWRHSRLRPHWLMALVAGGWGGIPQELRRFLSLIGYGSTGGVCGRSLTAVKILFTKRQTCSLYLVLWLCECYARSRREIRNTIFNKWFWTILRLFPTKWCDWNRLLIDGWNGSDLIVTNFAAFVQISKECMVKFVSVKYSCSLFQTQHGCFKQEKIVQIHLLNGCNYSAGWRT